MVKQMTKQTDKSLLEGNYVDGREFILYGGNCWEAEKFYYYFKKRNMIAYFAYQKECGLFHGKKIYSLYDIGDIKKYVILVATDWKTFLETRKTLEAKGLKEFKDYYYAEAYSKKIAIVHANCYQDVYIEFLKRSQCFTEKYFIYPTVPFHGNGDHRIPDDVMNVCDLFIYQDVRKENDISPYISDDYNLPRLKKDCKRVVVPNLVSFGLALYPDFLETKNFPKITAMRRGQNSLFYGNKILDESFMNKKTLTEIEADFLDENCITEIQKNDIKEFFERKIMKSLVEREEKWDVKISDYIIRNFKSEKMFTDRLHPSRNLMKEICRRLGNILELNDVENIELDANLDMCESFVMPCVKKALGLTFDEKYVRVYNRLTWPSNKLIDGQMDLKEYIREYIYWKYDKFIE